MDWLCEDMLEEGLSLDQMDLGGNTPLHLAARWIFIPCGFTVVHRISITYSDVYCSTEMYTTVHYSTLQYTTVHCCTLEYTRVH